MNVKLPNEDQSVELERLHFERERIRLERQKLATEIRLKRRDLRENNKDNFFKGLVANPLILAIAGGFITLMTSVVTTSYTAKENRDANESQARRALEAELVKKFVEAPSDTVRANLKFLVDANLLPDYAEGITAYLKNNPGAAPNIGNAFDSTVRPFEQQAPLIMRSLISDFGLADFQAAGILGNIGFETNGFGRLYELGSGSAERGGVGYMSWTGQKRREFEAFAQANNIRLTSAEANYRFMRQQLEAEEKDVIIKIKLTKTLEESTTVFGMVAERPRTLDIDARIGWAKSALQAFSDSSKRIN